MDTQNTYTFKMCTMKKAYLVDTLPEEFNTKSAPPDIKQKLEAYRNNKRELISEAPEIKPSPLEKYSINKIKETWNNDDTMKDTEPIEMPAVTFTKSDIENVLDSLPKNLRARAKKLLPFVLQTNYGDLDLKDLLYDLTNKKSKNVRSHNIALLDSVIKQLHGNHRVPKYLYVHKYSEVTELPKSVSAGQRTLPLRSKSMGQLGKEHISRRDEFIRSKNINWL